MYITTTYRLIIERLCFSPSVRKYSSRAAPSSSTRRLTSNSILRPLPPLSIRSRANVPGEDLQKGAKVNKDQIFSLKSV